MILQELNIRPLLLIVLLQKSEHFINAIHRLPVQILLLDLFDEINEPLLQALLSLIDVADGMVDAFHRLTDLIVEGMHQVDLFTQGSFNLTNLEDALVGVGLQLVGGGVVFSDFFPQLFDLSAVGLREVLVNLGEAIVDSLFDCAHLIRDPDVKHILQL